MVHRFDYRFNREFDLPLMGKPDSNLNYVFDRRCINRNYKYKISYEAFYSYCLNMAHFIAGRVGLGADLTTSLHDYFTFYLSDVRVEFPTIRICMSVPASGVDFVFTFSEKSSRQCFDDSTLEYNDRFYDISALYIYVNDYLMDIDSVGYSEIAGYNTADLEYFCRYCFYDYIDCSYILLDNLKGNRKGSSRYEVLLLEYFGGSVSVESETKSKISFDINNYEIDGFKAFNSVFMCNEDRGRLEYLSNFQVSSVTASITYDKVLRYVKIDYCSCERRGVFLDALGLPYADYDTVEVHPKKPTTDNEVMVVLYDAFIKTALKNILYELLE